MDLSNDACCLKEKNWITCFYQKKKMHTLLHMTKIEDCIGEQPEWLAFLSTEGHNAPKINLNCHGYQFD